jgi:pyrroline-5-carboxylate reductase
VTHPLPITLLGHGRLGSALAEGWRLTAAAKPKILTRADEPVCLSDTRALVIAVKPASWREAVAPLALSLPHDAVVVSVMAGVRASDIARVLERPIARVMPTTAVAQAQGVAAIWSDDPRALILAHALFDPVAETVELGEEALLDLATAVAGSGPAFFHAFAPALAAAGVGGAARARGVAIGGGRRGDRIVTQRPDHAHRLAGRHDAGRPGRPARVRTGGCGQGDRLSRRGPGPRPSG